MSTGAATTAGAGAAAAAAFGLVATSARSCLTSFCSALSWACSALIWSLVSSAMAMPGRLPATNRQMSFFLMQILLIGRIAKRVLCTRRIERLASGGLLWRGGGVRAGFLGDGEGCLHITH